LLRVLESGEYTRLGSSTPRKVDVRVVAATNRDLEEEIHNGNFRQDLYFRLKSVSIVLPPLREHPADIPLLINYVGESTAKKLKFKYQGVDRDAISVLQSLPWPGNIRELRNLIETIITLEKGAIITPEVLRKYIPPALPAFEIRQTLPELSLVNISRNDNYEGDSSLIFKTLLELKSDINSLKLGLNELISEMHQIKLNTDNLSLHKYEEIDDDEEMEEQGILNLADKERQLIINALKKYHGNRRLASDALGISQRTLYRKLAEYQIEV